MECKKHSDVSIEAKHSACLSWEYQESQHGRQPSLEGTDGSPWPSRTWRIPLM